ncbi:28S ribosomal protein S15, mitochondrial [Trichinella zimbabwensis]|uniref:Small ribosomal subunit protein uS15m n=2 Tax=Trichinella zimbabwensis TaxID=268475 RepID=A0A0V1HT69_9BILA|nr:28S ribosomal protein S15, mitochondrial [Trichinella zimbabwensis]
MKRVSCHQRQQQSAHLMKAIFWRKQAISMSCSWFVQSRFLSCSCFMHTRFKWYNIRRPATVPKQADPAYYENLALSVPLAQGYIERLGEIWFEMVSVSRDVNFKRDDILIKHDSTHWLPHVDIKQPKAQYESVKALEAAPESVKKLFSIEFGCRKDLTFQWKRSLMNKVRQNELDTSSLEVRIAKHTALIRHWSQLLSEMKSKPGWLRQSIYISINHRRKLLRLLREQDKESFENVLNQLKIAYYAPPINEDLPSFTRKGWIEYIIRRKVEMIKDDKLRAHHEILKKRQEIFLSEKEPLLAALDEEEKAILEELNAVVSQKSESLKVVGEYAGHEIDQISENEMHSYYYMPNKLETERIYLD